MSDFKILVQKFGGSSVAECEKIKSVASFIKKSLTHDKKICVVVSAMGKTTDNLLSLAKQISTNPLKRELDMLLSCGERSSMALLSIALQELGVKSISLTGSQSGIITDNNHFGAKIIEIRPSRVLEAFKDFSVVIIAGFQGVSQDKEITTLRRGGSDTTAVAMAAALNAYACEIYTDVDGVMSADPHILQNVQALPTITFEQMNSMALFGAKILAYDAAKIAQKFNIELKIAKTNSDYQGTSVVKNCNIAYKKDVHAITHLRSLIQVKLPLDFNISNLSIVYAHQQKEHINALINNDHASLVADLITNKGLALVTLHHTSSSFDIFKKAWHILRNNYLSIHDYFMTQNEVLFIIKDEDLTKILNILHDSLITE